MHHDTGPSLWASEVTLRFENVRGFRTAGREKCWKFDEGEQRPDVFNLSRYKLVVNSKEKNKRNWLNISIDFPTVPWASRSSHSIPDSNKKYPNRRRRRLQEGLQGWSCKRHAISPTYSTTTLVANPRNIPNAVWMKVRKKSVHQVNFR
jgi:hypothetical protein